MIITQADALMFMGLNGLGTPESAAIVQAWCDHQDQKLIDVINSFDVNPDLNQEGPKPPT